MKIGMQSGSMRGHLSRLLESGTVAGLGDGEFLDRFVSGGDERAFSVLAERLGPMVWGVCRRMLRDERDAEDAYQATFLVLARRAHSIRDRDVVATWLHAVAVRVALRARSAAARRGVHERRAAVDEACVDVPRLERDELRAAIDEEVARLPESHRRAVILCDLEGLSRDEAAARLGWTVNMVRGRLERARVRLRGRLSRRGLHPAAAPLVPFSLAGPALRPALSFTACRLEIPAAVASLSRGTMPMMNGTLWKVAATTLVSAGALTVGAGLLPARQGTGQGPPASPPPAIAAPAPSKPIRIDPGNSGSLPEDPIGTTGKPSPGAAYVIPGPARAPRADDAATPKPGSLGEAVAELNRRYLNADLGRPEPALTEEEVVAAIRFWRPDRETTTVRFGQLTNMTQPNAPIEAFRAIAETRRMPPGARFQGIDFLDVGHDVVHQVCWVQVLVPGAGGHLYPFPIRTRMIRACSFEEILERDEAALKGQASPLGIFPLLGSTPADRVEEYRRRIVERDAKAGR